MRLVLFLSLAVSLVAALPQDPAPVPPVDPAPGPPPDVPPPDQPPPNQPPAPEPAPPTDESPTPEPPPTDPPQPEPEPPATPVPDVPAPTVTGGPPGPICECGYTYCASVLQAMKDPWSVDQLSEAYCNTPNATCPDEEPRTPVKEALYVCLCDDPKAELGNQLNLLCGCDECLVVGPDYRGRCATPCYGSCDD